MKRWLSTLALLAAALLCTGATIHIPGPLVPAAAGGSINLGQAFSNFSSSGTVTDIGPITKPAGTVDGDFLLGIFVARDDAAAVPITLPSGWTSIVEVTDPGFRVATTHVAYRRASSEPSTYTATHAAALVNAGVIWRLTGVVGSGDPESGTRSVVHDNVGGFSWSATGMTTANNNAAVISIRVHRNIAITASNMQMNGVACTERIDVDKIAICADILATAGATGTFTGDDTQDNDRTLVVFALKP